MLYALIFGLLAVLLVVAGLTMRSRNNAALHAEDAHHRASGEKQQRKTKRAQSRKGRRKRH
jgi:hypothetical protein